MVLDAGHHIVRQVGRRDHTGTITAVDPGLLDVLHDCADHHLAGVVAHGIHVHLGGVLKEPVYEHGPFGRKAALDTQAPERAESVHCPIELCVVVDDLHGPSAQHV